jgi:hypothetical protein
MSNREDILQLYERGVFTASDAAIRLMALLSEQNIDSVLRNLPASIVERIEQHHPFARTWPDLPPKPRPDQVELAHS